VLTRKRKTTAVPAEPHARQRRGPEADDQIPVVQSLLLADPAGEAELVDVPGDGNCLLSALALVFDDSRSVADIRRATCTYVKAHWKELNWPHIMSQSAADSWYERYRRDRVWVGHDFAFAYCTANAVNLSVSLLHTPRKGKNKGVPSLKEELIIAKPELREVRRIVYVNDNHYCAIIHMGPLVADADIDNVEELFIFVASLDDFVWYVPPATCERRTAPAPCTHEALQLLLPLLSHCWYQERRGAETAKEGELTSGMGSWRNLFLFVRYQLTLLVCIHLQPDPHCTHTREGCDERCENHSSNPGQDA
jgi:hypothetical protein